jgi:hypothetical protein
MTLVLGLAIALGSVAVVFAQGDSTKTEPAKKTKKKKAPKKEETPKKEGR